MNPFQNILSKELQQTFNDAIDSLIDPVSGLVNPCILRYGGTPSNQTVCYNCILDTISRVSSNMYNGTGPKPFPDYSICPVCLGFGLINGGISTSEETINLAVIMNAKSFINVADTVDIGNNVIQTISKIDLLSKLNNAIELYLGENSYQKMADPQLCGFGEYKYITMLWKQK